jgi:hypothetical protein
VALTAPESLKREHEELHADLVAATKAGGKTPALLRRRSLRRSIPIL